MDRHEKLAAVAGVALATGLGFCFGKISSAPVEARCIVAVVDICEGQTRAECGDHDADCLKFGDRYCRARASNECGGDE